MKKYLKRLCNNIISGKFAHKRYRKERKYYGLTLRIDSEYVNGNYGMSVIKDGKCLYWIWRDKNLNQLNIGGRPYKEVLDNMNE